MKLSELIAKKKEESSPLNQEEHKAHHLQIHKAFDELIADYIRHNPEKRALKTSIGELAVWSHEQTIDPTEIKENIYARAYKNHN